MSLGYIYTSKTSIQNIGAEYISNISTQNGDILLGTNAGSMDPGTGLIAIGTNAGQYSIGPVNTFIGLNAAPSNINGGSNIFIGPSVALNNTSGSENIFLGVLAGTDNKVGNRNIYLGHLAGGLNVDGNYNLVIGNFNSSTQFSNYMHSNFNNALNIGNLGLVYGDNSLGIGNGNIAGKNSLVIGNQAAGTSNHSLTIGNNVVNNGVNNVVIITDSNLYNSNGTYITNSNNVVIINSLKFDTANGSTMMTAPGVAFGISNGGVVLSNAQGYIKLNNDGIQEYTVCNYEVSTDNATFMMDSNGVLLDTTNFDLYSFSNSLIMNSNMIDLYSGDCNAINIHNSLYAFGIDSNAVYIEYQGESNITFSSNLLNVSVLDTIINSNLYVYGTTNLSNTDIYGVTNAYGPVNFNSSNIDFLYGLSLDKLLVNNVDMYSTFTSLSNYISQIVNGVNTASSGTIISGLCSCPTDVDRKNINFQGSVNVKSNLYVGGVLCAEKISFSKMSVTGPVTFSNAVAFNGNVFMNSNLYVDGIGSFNSNFSVNGITYLNDKLNVIGNTNFGMDVSVEGKLLVKNIDILATLLSKQTPIYFNSNPNPSTFSNTVLFNSNVIINGNLLVDNVNILNELATLSNYMFTLSNLVIENDTFSNNVYMNSNLNILGNLFVDNIDILSKLSSLSNYVASLTYSSTITSDYSGTCPAFTDSNNINFNEGSLIIQDNLHVGGVLCADTVSFHNMNISGPLVFSGPVTFECNIDISQFSLNGNVNSNNSSNLQNLLDQFILNGGKLANATIYSSNGECPAFTDSNNINFNEGSLIIQDNLHVGGVLCADTISFKDMTFTGSVNFSNATINGPVNMSNLIVDNIDIRQFSLNGIVNSNNSSNLQTLLDQFILIGGKLANATISSSNNSFECPAFTDSNNINFNEGSLIIQDNLHVGGVLCADSISFKDMTFAGSMNFSNATINGPVNFDNSNIIFTYPLSNLLVDNIDIGQFSLNGIVNSNNSSNLQKLLDQYVLNGGNLASAWITGSSNDLSNCPAFSDSNNININEGSLIIQDHLHVGGTLCADTMQFNNIDINGVVQANSDFVFDGKAIFNGPLWINGDFQLVNSNILNLVQSQPLSTTSITLCNGGLTIVDSNNNWWMQYLNYNNNSLDLVFQSRGGAMVVFNDDFSPEVLNFTGKHRCKFIACKASKKSLIGKIVYSTGKYCNLKNEYITKIDEAIPIVSLCKRMHEPRIFGVIGGFDKKPVFKIGNLQFINPELQYPRIIVQSSGEGLIRVCDYNGKIKNGDYITSSPIAGIGMKQSSKMCFNYTIGKVTCDMQKHKKNQIKYKNRIYNTALVGCVYNL